MAYCQLPMETGWNTIEPREGNVWTSLNMAPSQRITLESPMNLVKHINSSPLKRTGYQRDCIGLHMQLLNVDLNRKS